MTKNENKNPKVFISYSWSPPAHKDWVLKLARDLMNNGVDVVFDQWDVSAGDDINTYMEKMVSDETIDKVIMVCNASYAQKTDSREKGVGVEAQIISGAIYKKTKQSKFIPVISEVDDKGEAYLPAYCKSRFYIDMSNEERYSDGLEELLRAIYNEPLNPKPETGSKPNFSSNTMAETSFSSNMMAETSISAIAQRACVSMRERNSNAADVVEECLFACIDEMEKLSFEENHPEAEVVVNRVNEFLPIRNDMVKVFQGMVRYLPEDSREKLLHGFFEQMLIYYEPGRNVTGAFMRYKADHFKFLVHEMFLYAIAALIKRKKFDAVAALIDREYYVPTSSRLQGMLPFSEIMVSPLDIRHWDVNKDALPKQKNMSSRSDVLIKRATVHDLSLVDIQQADLVLAIGSVRFPLPGLRFANLWAPAIAPYVENNYVFEIFMRAQSKKYFEEMKKMLGVDSPGQISRKLNFLHRYMSSKNWHYPNFSSVIGVKELCKRP